MIYTVDRAGLLAEQLRRFHHGRFEQHRDAQNAWVDAHKTQVPVHGFCGICRGKCEFDDGKLQSPRQPKRRASREKAEARLALVDATYRLLTRFFRMGLIGESELRTNCERVGTSIDPADLRRD